MLPGRLNNQIVKEQNRGNKKALVGNTNQGLFAAGRIDKRAFQQNSAKRLPRQHLARDAD
jgi:hypothetical protein